MLHLVRCRAHTIFRDGSLDIDFTQPDHSLRMSHTSIFHPLGMSMIHQMCMNNFSCINNFHISMWKYGLAVSRPS